MKSGTKTNNGGTGYTEIIHLLDSSDTDDDGTTTKVTTTKFRVLEDNCLLILDSDDEDNIHQACAATSSSTTALPPTGLLATAGTKKSGRRKRTTAADKENAPTKNSQHTNADEDDQDGDKKPAATKKTKFEQNNNNTNNNSAPDDDDVMAVPAPPTAFVPAVAASAVMPHKHGNKNEDDEEEIELVGHTGHNALSDFPHSRENCVQHVFQLDPQKFCPNCYCFVCDIPAADCSLWPQHCVATYSSPRWKAERERNKKGWSSPPQQPQQPSQPPQHPPPQHRSFTNSVRRSRHLPVKTLLDAVTRVYPSERSPPASSGFTTTLRHYQKQSLSFMIDTEENQAGWTAPMTVYGPYVSGQPPIHRTDKFQTRGGWLCSEVGMGKTAVIIALVAAKPAPQPLSSLPKLYDRARIKATVVMTSVSLMGQWEDECRKHAPTLKVVRFHPSAKKTSRDAINTADIIITSATYYSDRWSLCGVNLDRVMFHRVVMDESHLFYSKSGSASSDKARSVPAMNRWCCTATPMTSTAKELESQGNYLRMDGDLCNRLSEDTEFLKQHMIRHVKAQKINGIDALALPKSTSSVRMVTMTPVEQCAYAKTVKDNLHTLERMKSRSLKFFNVRNQIVYTLTKPLIQARSSKIIALENAIMELMRKDPNVRVVVFTQMREQLMHVKTMVHSLSARTRGGVGLYSFDGSSSHKKRDDSIRQFQSTARPGPAVFGITLNTGSVGITLTAASHVFLLEPSIDPADEIQAAGRINRLGQTKQVAVTKFVYKDTYESNVITLHEQIASGAITFNTKSIPKAAACILLKDV